MEKLSRIVVSGLTTIERFPHIIGPVLMGTTILFFGWLQWSPYFPDPDSFYHLKIAELMREQKNFIASFPWLPHTILPNVYADQSWLYHAVLIPFTYLPDPFIGLKIATVFLEVTLIMFIYWLMRKWAIKFPWIFIIILLLTNPFIFRISLAKTPAISVLLFLAGFYFIFRQSTHGAKNKGLMQRLSAKRGNGGNGLPLKNQLSTVPDTTSKNLIIDKKNRIPIFILSTFFVWTHGAWPLLIIASGVYWMIGGIFSFKDFLHSVQYKLPAHPVTILCKCFFKTHEKFIFIASSAGALTGLIINPFFPKSILFFWYQTILISIWNFKDTVGVGSEWYGFDPSELIGSSIYISIGSLIAAFIFFMTLKNQTKKSWTLFVMTFLLCIATLKSRRNAEYLIPTATLFMALVFTATSRETWKEIKKIAEHSIKKNLLRVGICYLGIALCYITFRDTARIHALLTNGYSRNTLSGTCLWISKNVSKNEIITHSEWEQFPVLFRCAPQFRYIVGLDPTFLFLASPEKYAYWRDLQHAQKAPDAKEFEHTFASSLFIVSADRNELLQALSQSTAWRKEYTDNEITIYSTPSRFNKRATAVAYQTTIK